MLYFYERWTRNKCGRCRVSRRRHGSVASATQLFWKSFHDSLRIGELPQLFYTKAALVEPSSREQTFCKDESARAGSKDYGGVFFFQVVPHVIHCLAEDCAYVKQNVVEVRWGYRWWRDSGTRCQSQWGCELLRLRTTLSLYVARKQRCYRCWFRRSAHFHICHSKSRFSGFKGPLTAKER